MLELHGNTALPTPTKALTTDDPISILEFAVLALQQGDVALVTLTGIEGGAARSLGAQMAVAADGRFCGYVSGGCVEAAVAFEALLAIQQRRDRSVSFGAGSPFIDIILPCGGGITMAIHILDTSTALSEVIDRVKGRQAAGLLYCPADRTLEFAQPPGRACWSNGTFATSYTPRIRVYVSGESIEAQHFVRLAQTTGYEIRTIGSKTGSSLPELDPYSAVIFLHHDLDAETKMLNQALNSTAFYIGALGSTRTHRSRTERLLQKGWAQSEINRIKAPIGIFGPTKDATSLAISVLADIAASKAETFV